MMKFLPRLIFLLLLILSISCQQDLRKEEAVNSIEPISDGEYDSEFPMKPVSDYLTQISESVHLLSVLAFYQSYHFERDANIRKEDLLYIDLDEKAADKLVFERPASGTASLIYFDKKRLAFLTCAHIVQFPDTVINYYKNSDNEDTKIVKSFIYKVRQTNNVINQPVAYDFQILAADPSNDIAIIGKKAITGREFRLDTEMDKKTRPPLLVLDTPLGKARDLQFGTFVYIMGFPQAKKMVSTAIVSSPDYDRQSSFILDATLQKGISGGLVLAIRDGVPNFEVIGMIKAISGRTQYSLAPDRKTQISQWDLYKPYEDKIYLEKQELSEPGMTFAVGIEKIIEFIKNNEPALLKAGYLTEKFFKRF
jgi:hypothetical protein